ncbi:MAG: glycosyl hydrolase, partial [Bryobacteraceae bacterium]|nr:glycosyl hydrolase [Bryobacteraceae bacterium]
IFGAYMHARAGLELSSTPYFSEGFWEAVRASVEHGARRGFRTWIYDEDKWPSGAAGGRTIAANPVRFRATGLQHRTERVQGPARVRIHFPEAMFVVAAREASPGRIHSASLTDLTETNRSGGIWEAPQGAWLISIFEPVRGREELPNYLNPETVAEFIRNTYEQYAERFREHFGKTIPGSFFDEIFNLRLAWDPLLEERFRARKGYELRKVLPLMFLDGDRETIKVRCDYFEEFTRLYEDAWFRQLSSWCERNGLKLTGHTNEGLYNIQDQGDYFRTWRHPHIPGTDNEDFRYSFPRVIGSWKPKQLSSVAHVYGRPRAMAEALGGAGWAITLDEARYGVNMLAVYGINYFIFHLFHYAMDTPLSMDDWPNSWFYENPYWKYFKKLADYIRRISFLTAQGKHVADVAVLYPVEEVWSHGMKNPPPGEPPVVELVDRLVREPLDCDLVDTDSIVKAEPQGSGGARIGTESYRVLILPRAETVSLAAYRRIAELAREGLLVVALGAPPRHSAENGGDDPEVIRISEELFPKGARVFARADELVRWLRRQFPADMEILEGPAGVLRYLHRTVNGREVYFLVNSERRAARWRLRLRARGPAEKWDPETGRATALQYGDGVLELDFLPWQAYFVVLGAGGVARPEPVRRAAGAIEIAGPWTIQLCQTELDHVWRADPGPTRVEVPVADFRFERSGPEPPWRRLKIRDPLNPKQGVARYLSAWDGWWITRYVYRRHFGDAGGPRLWFLKELDVPFEPVRSRLAVVADGKFELQVNGSRVGAGAPLSPEAFTDLPLKRGRNSIAVEVRGDGFLLAQGEVCPASGECVAIHTGRDWRVRAPGEEPREAYEYALPPFGKWGEPAMPGASAALPRAVWYRVAIPPGARSLEPPEAKGDWEVFINGRALRRAGSGPMPLPAGRELRLRVRLKDPTDGLLAPLVFHTGPAPGSLGDWSRIGLDWYSGRMIYRARFRVPHEFRGARLVLDLGDLRYTGEVWVNGRLVETFAWPPYRTEITEAVREGENELVVVAANLLANQMRWNIFDSVISNRTSRWWHDGNILREADKLTSGLLGPVRVEAWR